MQAITSDEPTTIHVSEIAQRVVAEQSLTVFALYQDLVYRLCYHFSSGLVFFSLVADLSAAGGSCNRRLGDFNEQGTTIESELTRLIDKFGVEVHAFKTEAEGVQFLLKVLGGRDAS